MITSSTKPVVILIHGLHQSPWIMRFLANHLTKNGYYVYRFGYQSLRADIHTHSQKLVEFVTTYGISSAHLVGHSLGGLVIRQFLFDCQKTCLSNFTAQNIVTLGTPHLGSISAHYIQKISPFLLGKSYLHSLDGHCAPLIDGACLGVIAGSKAQGLGNSMLWHYQKQQSLADARHDGTVFVFETKLPNLSDHITLPVSHTGMLLDKQVAIQTDYFLKNGRFDSTNLFT